MPDLEFQNLSTVQNNLMPGPVTIVATAVISPTTFLTRLTAGVAVTTINPPVTGTHMLALSFAGVTGVATGGNITTTVASVANRPLLLIFDPNTRTYLVGGGA